MVSKSLSALFGEVDEVEAEEAEEQEAPSTDSGVGLNWSAPEEAEEAAPKAEATPPAAKAKKSPKRASGKKKPRYLESDHWHDDPASRHQTMKIWKITKIDVRPLKLTKKDASVLIDKGLSDAATLRADLLTVDGVIDRANGKQAPQAKVNAAPKAKAKAKAAPAEAMPAKASKPKAASKPKTTKTSKEDKAEMARLRKQIAGYKAAATRRKNAEAA